MTAEGRAPTLSICVLRPTARPPQRASEHAAGLDLAADPEDGSPVTIPPGGIRLIACGFAMSLPPGFEAQVRPRSGLATKHGISMPNAPGTIDADYRGEVMVPLINHGPEPFTVEPGMRIAQMVVAPVAYPQTVRVGTIEELGATQRGGGGFGSTGR